MGALPTCRFEYMGGLFSNREGGDFFCAGTLIAPRIFMTAGKEPGLVAPAIRLNPAHWLLHTHAESRRCLVCPLPQASLQTTVPHAVFGSVAAGCAAHLCVRCRVVPMPQRTAW